MRTSLALFLLLCCFAAPTPARAEDASDQRARLHNESGKRLFALGMFAEAAEEYKKAYRESPKPAFLFNLGQCFKRLPGSGNLERAIFYYRGFLRGAPDSSLRAHVEQEIASLERRLEEARRGPASAPAAATAATPLYKRWWVWTLVGLAVTGAAVGTGLALRPEPNRFEGSLGSITLPLGGAR